MQNQLAGYAGCRATYSARYQAPWPFHDIVAGLVLATILVPVGIAYAAASGLLSRYGLYPTIVPLLVYAVFGHSPILVDQTSSLAAAILGVVLPLADGYSPSLYCSGQHHGGRFRDSLYSGRRCATGLCDRTSLQADSLWTVSPQNYSRGFTHTASARSPRSPLGQGNKHRYSPALSPH
jgi:hypothetical protein